jgi:hypothetical protein
MDADIRFIDMPGFAGLSVSPSTQLIRHERGKTGFPLPNGLMGELKAPLQEHLSQIPQTQLVPQPPENDKKDDISGIFQKVEGSPCAFVEGTSAI